MASRQDYLKNGAFGYSPEEYARLLDQIKKTEDSFNTPGSQLARDPSNWGVTPEDLQATQESKNLVDEGYGTVAQAKSFERQRKIEATGRVQAEQTRAEAISAQAQAEMNAEREKLRTEITLQLMDRGMSGLHASGVTNKILTGRADQLSPEEEEAFLVASENKNLKEQIQRAAEKLTVQGQDAMGNPVIKTASPEEMSQFASNIQQTYQRFKTQQPVYTNQPVQQGGQVIRNAQGKLIQLPPGMTMNREGYLTNEQPQITGASATPTKKVTPKETFQERKAKAQGTVKQRETIGGVEMGAAQDEFDPSPAAASARVEKEQGDRAKQYERDAFQFIRENATAGLDKNGMVKQAYQEGGKELATAVAKKLGLIK